VRRLLTSSRNCYAVIFGNCTAKFIRDLHNFFRKVARRRTHDSNLYLHIHSSSTVVISLIRYCKALYPFCYTIDRCPAQRRFIHVGDIKQSRLHLQMRNGELSSKTVISDRNKPMPKIFYDVAFDGFIHHTQRALVFSKRQR